MKGYNYWSYAPYKPLLWETGDIYICRVVPSENSIHFEWLKNDEDSYDIYYRERDNGDFIFCGSTDVNEYDIKELREDTDYEFYVESGNKKSRTRLARCGKSVGTVVNYFHPDDKAYAFSGSYLCSPSLVRHPDGFLLASMDFYGVDSPQNLTLIYRSDDDGNTWHYVSELMPCFWGKMFIHKNELYMLACSTEYGDLLISKSTDGGKTFCAPVTLLRGAGGKGGHSGVHKNPQNVVHFNGRIYETLEWGSWKNQEYCHAAMVMSCDENDDLLVPENWSFTEPKKFNPSDAPEISEMAERTMTIEGTLVVSPENKLLNIMRFSKPGYALAYEVDTQDNDAPLKYSYCMAFNAHFSKFMIKFDEKSKKYLSIADYIDDRENIGNRNHLVLMASSDLVSWDIVCDLFDYRHEDASKVGFQYVDFEIENDDIIYLCRTAMNNANSYHDSNYSTFHRIEDFRQYLR